MDEGGLVVGRPVNFEEKLGLIDQFWAPRIVAQMNDYHFKLAKFQGEFVWHSHDETDEVFIVIQGECRLDFLDGATTLSSGEMLVVPKGVEHRPVAEAECHVLLVEPAGTQNTGDAGGERTVAAEWV
jgi:mannose-6-phosphate isomerase-like protein (cupin superfamily)